MSARRLDAAGEPVFGRPTSVVPTGSEATVTLLNMRLRVFKTEWFLDQTVGLTLQTSDVQLLESEVKQIILSTEGVAELLSFSLTFDHDTRRVAIDALASDVYGEPIPLKTVLP